MSKNQKWQIAFYIIAGSSLLAIIFNALCFFGILMYTLDFFSFATPLVDLAVSIYFIVSIQKEKSFSALLFSGIYCALLGLFAFIWLAFGHTFQPRDILVLALHPFFAVIGFMAQSNQQ